MSLKFNNMKNTCYCKGNWWSGDYYDHDWGYINSKKRKCLKCGEVEILIAYSNYNGQDWRKKYIKK